MAGQAKECERRKKNIENWANNFTALSAVGGEAVCVCVCRAVWLRWHVAFAGNICGPFECIFYACTWASRRLRNMADRVSVKGAGAVATMQHKILQTGCTEASRAQSCCPTWTSAKDFAAAVFDVWQSVPPWKKPSPFYSVLVCNPCWNRIYCILLCVAAGTANVFALPGSCDICTKSFQPFHCKCRIPPERLIVLPPNW